MTQPKLLYISALAELYHAAGSVIEKAKQDGALSGISKEIFELRKAIEKAEGSGEKNGL